MLFTRHQVSAAPLLKLQIRSPLFHNGRLLCLLGRKPFRDVELSLVFAWVTVHRLVDQRRKFATFAMITVVFLKQDRGGLPLTRFSRLSPCIQVIALCVVFLLRRIIAAAVDHVPMVLLLDLESLGSWRACPLPTLTVQCSWSCHIDETGL